MVARWRLGYLCPISRTYVCIESVTVITIVYYIEIYMLMLNKTSASESVGCWVYINYMKNCGFGTEDSRLRIIWQRNRILIRILRVILANDSNPDSNPHQMGFESAESGFGFGPMPAIYYAYLGSWAIVGTASYSLSTAITHLTFFCV